MDSERRHELETNDLREFFDNFKDFWDKHGNKILIVLMIVLGIYSGPRLYTQWREGKAEEAHAQLGSATTVDQLIAVAEEHPIVHDEAMRRAGDLSLAEARDSKIKNSDAAAKKALDKAGSAYLAIADRGQSTAYQLVGYEGLAKVAEMSGKWDQAQSNYEKIISLAGETYLAQAERAKAGLEQIDKHKSPLAFAPDDDLSFTPDPVPDTPAEDDADKPGGDAEPEAPAPAPASDPQPAE